MCAVAYFSRYIKHATGGHLFLASRKSGKWEADIDIRYSLRIGWKAEIPRASSLRAFVC